MLIADLFFSGTWILDSNPNRVPWAEFRILNPRIALPLSLDRQYIFYASQAVKAKLDEETEKKHNLFPCCFVVFRSLRTSTLALQSDWDNSPLEVDVIPATELASVLWNNLPIGLCQRCFYLYLA